MRWSVLSAGITNIKDSYGRNGEGKYTIQNKHQKC